MYQHTLARAGGVVRTSALLDTGLSRHLLAQEIESGRLRRVRRRGWIARPDADPDLIFAAEHGLTLSCITQAARLGLWVREQAPRHYAVPRPGAEIRPEGARLHYRAPVTPRERFALVDSISNLLVCIAHCQPHEDAVAAWDSALNKHLIDRGALEVLPLRAAARAVLSATSPFADSGLESYVRIRLRWMRTAVRSQIWLLGHRVDFLIGDRLVLQIDGGHHVGAQRTSDITHDAELRLRGYSVIRVGYEQVMHRWHEVQEIIMRAIANGLHLAA